MTFSYLLPIISVLLISRVESCQIEGENNTFLPRNSLFREKFLSCDTCIRKRKQTAVSNITNKQLRCMVQKLKCINLRCQFVMLLATVCFVFLLKYQFTLLKNVLLTVKSSLYPNLNTEELDHQAKENSLACGLDAVFLPNIFRLVQKL